VFEYGDFEFEVLTLVPAIFGTFEAVSVRQKLIDSYADKGDA
jgi:hypothetical protein